MELIASGLFKAEEIARRTSMTVVAVQEAMRGRGPSDLQGRIRRTVRSNRLVAQRMGAHWLGKLITRHIQNGLEGDGETARKCREFAINKFLGQDPDAEPAAQTQADQARPLTADDYRAASKLNGGPCENDKAPQQN